MAMEEDIKLHKLAGILKTEFAELETKAQMLESGPLAFLSRLLGKEDK